MYIIKWHPYKNICNNYTSSNKFTLERATELCEIANDYFTKAFHWIEEIN